jgi:hypothetical protein
MIAQGRLDETARLLQLLLEAAEAGDRTSRVIEILLLQALAYQAKSDTDLAIKELKKPLLLPNREVSSASLWMKAHLTCFAGVYAAQNYSLKSRITIVGLPHRRQVNKPLGGRNE